MNTSIQTTESISNIAGKHSNAEKSIEYQLPIHLYLVTISGNQLQLVGMLKYPMLCTEKNKASLNQHQNQKADLHDAYCEYVTTAQIADTNQDNFSDANLQI